MLAQDGSFYGITIYVGTGISPTIFRVTTNGALTTLYYFTNDADPNGLTLGKDGNFCGTTTDGSASGAGTIFRFLLTPAIMVQPQSQTNYAGATAIFSVSATGFYPPTGYRWQKNDASLANGGNISGATNNTLTITDISDSDAANYSVTVTNAVGTVSSSNATLTVDDSVFIATQPLSQTAGAGSIVTFTTSVYGAPPFVFQWSFNQRPVGSPTTGTNFSSFTLTNVETNQAGNYTAQVFNGSGNVTSSNAVLIVIPQPTLALQVLAGYPVVSLSGTLANNFVVQYNSNLSQTNWLNLLSITNLSASPYLFLDPSAYTYD
jgi:hypothetical protein